MASGFPLPDDRQGTWHTRRRSLGGGRFRLARRWHERTRTHARSPARRLGGPPTIQRSFSKERPISRTVKRWSFRGSVRHRMGTRFLHRSVRFRSLSFAAGTQLRARPSWSRVLDVPGDACGGGADDPSGHILAAARPSPARCRQDLRGRLAAASRRPQRARNPSERRRSTSRPAPEEVFQAVHARRTRMAAAALHQAKTRAGSAKGCVTRLGAFAFDRLAALGTARPGSAPAQPSRDEVVAPRGKASPKSDSEPRRRLTLAERATSQPATRRRYYTGHRLPWPAIVKQDFHPAELSVIGVIFREIHEHELCDLALGTIAARAKCCRHTVQTAIRWAAHRGYLAIEERVKGTHVIRIASDAIRTWLAASARSESKISQQEENLNVPAKVATGHRGQRTPEESAAPDPIDEPPRPACKTHLGARTPTTVRDGDGSDVDAPRPSRLDATITLWRKKIALRRGPRPSGEGRPTAVMTCRVPRPG